MTIHSEKKPLAGSHTLLALVAGLVFLGWGAGVNGGQRAKSPDVLFIVVDDMNDWMSLLDPEAPIKTPNLERLSQRGMLFTRAYCVSPACNPSRAATLTGLRPSTTGVYGNKSDWRRAMPDRKTIMQRLMAAGYDVRGAGKIFHHHLNGAFHDDGSFHHFQHMRPQRYPRSKLNGSPKYGSKNTDWGEWPKRVEDSIDYHSASYCVKALSAPVGNKPLFLACGIYKPHSPFFAPSSYHHAYRDIALPIRKADDWSDLPKGASTLMSRKKWFWQGMMKVEQQKEGSYRNFVRAYAACAALADAQIGRVLAALDKSPHAKNTIVVLWSDHGWHLGEKQHWHKTTLWEEATRVPLIIRAPGHKPGVCNRPVSLLDLYPTLNELAGLEAIKAHDGVALTPLLRNPKAQWKRPAVIEFKRGNAAVRSDRYRYIRYRDGGEELYDHQTDPNEWSNLAASKNHTAIKKRLAGWIAKHWAESAPTKGAFRFDHEAFTWTRKKTGKTTYGKEK